MKPKLRIFISGANPIELAKCFKIASEAKRILSQYVDVKIVVIPPITSGRATSCIAIEDAGYVLCDEEDEALDRIIELSARSVMSRNFVEQTAAGGAFDIR